VRSGRFLLVFLLVASIPAAASAGGGPSATKTRTPGQIAFVLAKGRNSLAVMPAAGGKVRRLLRGGSVSTPSWSPERRRLVFSWGRRHNPAQLYLVRVADRSVRKLTRGPYSSIEPDWSRDGKQIAFVRVGDGPTHIEVLDVRTGRIRRLVKGRQLDGAPAFSPRGGRMAFTRLVPGPKDEEEEVFNKDIFVARADGASPVRVTRAEGPDSDPAWSPNGRWIAYSAGAGAHVRIWIMRANGRGKHAITQGPLDVEPTWSPDGRSIAFTRRVRRGASIAVVAVAALRPYSVTPSRLGAASSPDWG
jgi:TolB protein